MKTNSCLKRYLSSDWFVSLVLFGIYFLLKGYKLGWDDHHLEIPLLKRLIDPSLYPGDYYIDSLTKNFPTFFYHILAHFITVAQIPKAYFILYLVSRFFMVFWFYKIWLLISKQRFTAILCFMILITVGHIPEFLYRTFSHQEFCYPFIFAGLFMFFKGRYILAASIFGFAANIHSLYSFFAMFYLAVYLLWQRKQVSFKTIGKAFGLFVLFALPVVIWTLKKRFSLYSEEDFTGPLNWYQFYKFASGQNFIFEGHPIKHLFAAPLLWLKAARKYLVLLFLYLINFFFNKPFREDKKCQVVAISTFAFLAVTYFFTYIRPSRLIIDMNLIRHIQFLFFFVSGYITIFVVDMIDRKENYLGYLAALALCFSVFDYVVEVAAFFCFFSCLIFLKTLSKNKQTRLGKKTKFSTSNFTQLIAFILLIVSLTFLIFILSFLKRPGFYFLIFFIIELSLIFLALQFCKNPQYRFWIKRLWIVIPLSTFSIYGMHYYQKNAKFETHATWGFWKFQTDWEDMQRYVQANTPKDAVFLVPYDSEMGGFRIFSERTIVVGARDLGIVGFDYQAAVECLKRMNDIRPFTIILKNEIPLKPFLKVIDKYHVSYIVFMKYYAPKKEKSVFFEKIYENDVLALFKVRPHPSL